MTVKKSLGIVSMHLVLRFVNLKQYLDIKNKLKGKKSAKQCDEPQFIPSLQEGMLLGGHVKARSDLHSISKTC